MSKRNESSLSRRDNRVARAQAIVEQNREAFQIFRASRVLATMHFMNPENSVNKKISTTGQPNEYYRELPTMEK